MKKLFIILLVVFSFYTHLYTEETVKKVSQKYTDFDEALKASKESNKKLFVIFSGSDWCVNCQNLKKKVFDTAAFEKFASEQLIILVLDFPSDKAHALPKDQIKKNEALAEKYNAEGTFPRCILFSSEGKSIGEIKSYSKETPEEYIKIIKNLMEK